MKKTLRLCLIGLMTAIHPLAALAADTPPKQKAVKKNNASRSLPFHGKVAAVDLTANTITVGKRIFHLTAETKILKDNKPVSLNQEMVGERVGGAYVKASNGHLNAVTIRLGAKPDQEADDTPDKQDKTS